MNQTHAFLIEKLKDAFPDAKTDRDILRSALRNFRKDKGMSLTFEAFQYLDNAKIYIFEQIPRPNYLNSRETVLLDKYSDTPYYIGKTHIYITDDMQIFAFNMADTFEKFMEYMNAQKT